MENEIQNIIKDAVEELNEQLETEKKIEYNPEVRLIGKQSSIESMDFVTLVTIIEELFLIRPFHVNVVHSILLEH